MKKFFIHYFSLLYSNLTTFYEDLFLKTKTIYSELTRVGFYRGKLKFKNDYSDFIEIKSSEGDFSEKLIIKEKYISRIIDNIFIKNNIKKKLFELTGFNYSIDFLLAYSTYNINESNIKKDIYANHWHKDKPFSKNTLKIILPIDEILKDNGPMEIIPIKISDKINFSSNLKEIDFPDKYKLVGNEEDIFFFLPNLCYHRAGIPLLGLKRSQIMLQLNPSKEWKYSINLYKKQYLLEPKFPTFNLSDNYKLI